MAKTISQIAAQVDDLISQHTTEMRKQIRQALPDMVKEVLGQVLGVETKPAEKSVTAKPGPKRRGRPPKALAEARAQAAAAAVAPKKRGRPPKVKVEVAEEPKKAAKRGRPAKSSLDSLHAQAMALTQPGVKRRGRPPGSKNKPKDPVADTDSSNGDFKKTSFQELKAQLEAGRKIESEAVN